MTRKDPIKKAVGYARVSTEKQDAANNSIPSQLSKISAFAELRSLELLRVEEEHGASASTMDGRPAMARALEALRSGEADTLIVAKLDRLTRSVRDFADLLEEFEDNDWALVSCGELLDTGTASGRMVAQMIMVVSQWEREKTAERTREILGHRKERGLAYGKAPLGFRIAHVLDGTGKVIERKLVAVPEEQQALERIKALRARGFGCRVIADLLDEEGVPTREGRRWNRGSVNRILERLDSGE